MNTIVYYVVSASCATGTCPQPAVTITQPLQPVPVVIYQAAPAAFPWIAPRPLVIVR